MAEELKEISNNKFLDLAFGADGGCDLRDYPNAYRLVDINCCKSG